MFVFHTIGVTFIVRVYVCMYICMYVRSHTYSKNMDQPGKVANPARGQLNRGKKKIPVPVRVLICYE